MRKLVSNKVRCKKCDTIIESKHRHDWVSCPCGSVFTDGGLDYIRRGGDLEAMEDMTEFSLEIERE